MKKSVIIVRILLSITIVVIGLFFWFIAYSATTDISQDLPFKHYLNKPFLVKQPSALKRNSKNLNRFSEYYIDASSEEAFKSDKTILKKYNVGDTIIFSSAKKFFSYHVGDTHYLLGAEELDSGEMVTFQYGASFNYLPAIWETLEEFLERRKLAKDFP